MLKKHATATPESQLEFMEGFLLRGEFQLERDRKIQLSTNKKLTKRKKGNHLTALSF
jgi:uncharacterized protein YxjI